jgi:hypothetical protein
MESKSVGRVDEVLAAAVILAWPELMGNVPSGVAQMEYYSAPDDSIELVRIWKSTVRGYWHLVYACDALGQQQPVSREQPTDSVAHGFMGEQVSFIMSNQRTWLPAPNLGRTSSMVISTPLPAETASARLALRGHLPTLAGEATMGQARLESGSHNDGGAMAA